MRKLPLLIMIAGLLLSCPTVARADFTVVYPDDLVALAVNFDAGLNVVALISTSGDIYTIHSGGFSNPVLVSVLGLPPSRALFFFFLGSTPAGRNEYAVYVDQGSGFFFVGNLLV
jgi:hypothetical protein